MADTAGRYIGRKIVVVLALVAAIPLSVVGPAIDFPLQEYDHYLHLAAFTGMTVLVAWAYPDTQAWELFLPLVGLGAVTELVQALPGVRREADWVDFGFNVIAIVVTLDIIAVCRWIFRRVGNR